MDYLEKNTTSYKNAYAEGWGPRYVDTTWLTVFYRTARPMMEGRDNVKVLDFGCSIGSNSRMFRDFGYDVYGIDVSDIAVRKCAEINGFDPAKFRVANILEEGFDLEKFFGTKFDIVFASEVMYYFDDDGIRRACEVFKKAMNPGGVFMATMSTFNHTYYRRYMPKDHKRHVVDVATSGNLEESVYVNLMWDEKDLPDLFGTFETVQTVRSTMEFKDDFTERLFYIGKK